MPRSGGCSARSDPPTLSRGPPCWGSHGGARSHPVLAAALVLPSYMAAPAQRFGTLALVRGLSWPRAALLPCCNDPPPLAVDPSARPAMAVLPAPHRGGGLSCCLHPWQNPSYGSKECAVQGHVLGAAGCCAAGQRPPTASRAPPGLGLAAPPAQPIAMGGRSCCLHLTLCDAQVMGEATKPQLRGPFQPWGHRDRPPNR